MIVVLLINCTTTITPTHSKLNCEGGSFSQQTLSALSDKHDCIEVFVSSDKIKDLLACVYPVEKRIMLMEDGS